MNNTFFVFRFNRKLYIKVLRVDLNKMHNTYHRPYSSQNQSHSTPHIQIPHLGKGVEEGARLASTLVLCNP